MKIVALISDSPPLHYFVNTIHKEFPIHRVILQKEKLSQKQTFLGKLKSRGLKDVIAGGLIKLGLKIREAPTVYNYENIYYNILNNDWKKASDNISFFETDDINSDRVYQCIKDEKPDILLVHGTSLLKNRLIKLVEYPLNLHWGLSPYYRGTHCTEWALIHWDINNIGVTIHRISSAIDGGGVFAQGKPIIEDNDTVLSINLKLTKLGTSIILEALKLIRSESKIEYTKQNFLHGCLTGQKQYSWIVQQHIDWIQSNNIISQMLKNPIRKELPIIELK